MRHATIVFNPRSGGGRGERLAKSLSIALRAHDLACDTVPIHLFAPRELPGGLEVAASATPGTSALIVVGGDGSISSCASYACRTGVPLWHVPAGNENLFAREFGMSARPDAIVAALHAGHVKRVDLGRVTGGGAGGRAGGGGQGGGGATFLLMFSVGPDAGVIAGLAARRTGAAGHLAYAVPIWQEMWAPSLPRVRVEVDGRVVVAEGRGWLVVANSRHYALGINPAGAAKMDDGVLDICFFPCESSAGASAWKVLSLLGAECAESGAVVATGRAVRVRASDGPRGVPWQIDGECGGRADVLDCEITLEARCVPVLLPVSEW